MREIRLEHPRVSSRAVDFRWTVTPATPLYRRTGFRLEFPIDVATVPEPLWWRLALACLHSHWALLRPCRVVLPVRLAPGERELWLRLVDALTWSLEDRALGAPDDTRRVDLVESGPPLAPLAPAACGCGPHGRGLQRRARLARPARAADGARRAASCWSPRPRRCPASATTTAAGRQRAHATSITQRRDVELVEVRSDFRGVADPAFAWDRYGVAVTRS